MSRSVLWLALLCGCSSDDDTLKESHDFADGAGRACRATLERTSTSSPVVASTVACDGAGRECSSESTACFQLNVLEGTVELLNCPACCIGASNSFANDDCSQVVCAVDADCIYPKASCTEGVCTCPNGRCE